MNWVTQIIIVGVVLLFNLYILRTLRRELIDYKYALVWLFPGLNMLVFALFPKLLWIIATALGIGLPLNFLFFFAILFVLMICFRINITIANLKRRVYTLTQHVAVLDNKLREQESSNEKQS